jgi:hypothetical protein
MPSRLGLPRILLALTLVGLLGASSDAIRAQEPASVSPPPHVAYVDGGVTLERDGQGQAAAVNMPVVIGDRIHTTAGRIELLYPDGSTFDLDEYSTADFLSPTLIRLTEGRAILTVAGAADPAGAVRYQIDTPVATAHTDGPGEYRVALSGGRDGGETELAVARGSAILTTERGSTTVYAGERSVALDEGPPSAPLRFNSARFDAFDRWVAARRDARLGTTSAQYLPRDLRMYAGTFDRYGSWRYAEPYGYVWYPAVASDWRPYYYGYWSPIPTYGWTWIGVDFWSWPTHHYGRWGHLHGSWFWIPGRTWGPAWVSWAAAPGYVSWCPLGFDGGPVFALSVGFGHVWDGWVVVPRAAFGIHGYYVNRHAVAGHRLGRTTPFITQAAAPVAVPAVARTDVATAPASAGVAVRRPGAGNVAVPRAAPALSSTPQPVRADRATTAIRRLGSGDASPARTMRRPESVHPAFRRPLPETSAAPARIDRGVPLRSRSAGRSEWSGSATPIPRARTLERAPEVGGARYRAAPMEPPAPRGPASQAVPRWSVPRAEPPARVSPRMPSIHSALPSGAPAAGAQRASSMRPPPMARPQAAPQASGAARRAGSATQSQSSGGAGHSRAAPRSEGGHGGGRRR